MTMFPLTITHSQGVKIAYKYCLDNLSCGVAFREMEAVGNEIADVIGFGAWGHSVLIEVKVSRSDFLADKKKPFRKNPEQGVGRNRYYCCPAGLIKKEELPEGWGLIYITQTGKARIEYKPLVDFVNDEGNSYKRIYRFPVNREAETSIMYSALRRLHITNHIELCYLPEIERRKFRFNPNQK